MGSLLIMATKNPITGDALITKVNNKAYEDNYDKIFGNKKRTLNDVTPEEWDEAARKVREQDAKAKNST